MVERWTLPFDFSGPEMRRASGGEWVRYVDFYDANTRADIAERQLAERDADLARLRGAWVSLDNSISGAVKETDEPHRVLRDGRVVMEGEAAEIYFNHLMLLRKLARAALAGSGDGWRDMCATDGCGHKATVHFERGGIGSYYCHDCYMRIQALPASPSTAGER